MTARDWVAALLELAVMGSAHEADTNEELAAFASEADVAVEGEAIEIMTTDGRRFLVSVVEVVS